MVACFVIREREHGIGAVLMMVGIEDMQTEEGKDTDVIEFN